MTHDPSQASGTPTLFLPPSVCSADGSVPKSKVPMLRFLYNRRKLPTFRVPTSQWTVPVGPDLTSTGIGVSGSGRTPGLRDDVASSAMECTHKSRGKSFED